MISSSRQLEYGRYRRSQHQTECEAEIKETRENSPLNTHFYLEGDDVISKPDLSNMGRKYSRLSRPADSGASA